MDKPASPEREQTDESLRVERRKADDFLADKLTAIEEAADAVIEKARARADQVLAAGRAKMDRRSEKLGDVSSDTALQKERRLEDRVLEEERANADEILQAERVEGAELLTTERGETDKDLSHERSRSDTAVATRDELLGIVSHDLRNLLGAVMGFAGLIAKAESGELEHQTAQVLAHARRIQRSGTRMNRLVGDLVDVASIEAGALAVTPHLGDPRQVVTEVVDTFQAQAAANGVSLVAESPPGPGATAELDHARILQVLANLVGNAIKFTPAGGSVVVHFERNDKELCFAVRDTGRGISAAHLESVFERFQQIEKGDARGVGLGLYISKCIVQGHGGHIWAESRPNEGSTFRFTLPIRHHNQSG
jgi:signal transduction histidine kinase